MPMKIFLILLTLLFSATAFADEIINLKADMIILKCDESCVTPVQEGKPIQIALRAPHEGSLVIQGEYNIEKSIDDINFLGTLAIVKFKDNNLTKYFIQSNLFSLKGNDSSKQSLGNIVVLNTIDNLNSITWKGHIKDDDSTYVVSIIVGSDVVN